MAGGSLASRVATAARPRIVAGGALRSLGAGPCRQSSGAKMRLVSGAPCAETLRRDRGVEDPMRPPMNPLHAALNIPTPLVVELAGDYPRDRFDEALSDLALELEFAGEPQRLVVDLRAAGRLPVEADLELMSFLVEYALHLDRIAVVTHDPMVEQRTAFLAMRAGRAIRLFREFDEALSWSMNP